MARAKAKTRRTRTAHPGVKLKRRKLPSGGESWNARWLDPDDGRERSQSMEALGITSREARRAWAIKRAASLAGRKRDLAAGAPIKTETSVEEALERYWATDGARLREQTVTG